MGLEHVHNGLLLIGYMVIDSIRKSTKFSIAADLCSEAQNGQF